jgi:hypothetical protein
MNFEFDTSGGKANPENRESILWRRNSYGKTRTVSKSQREQKMSLAMFSSRLSVRSYGRPFFLSEGPHSVDFSPKSQKGREGTAL